MADRESDADAASQADGSHRARCRPALSVRMIPGMTAGSHAVRGRGPDTG
jgi:hypothetical protein